MFLTRKRMHNHICVRFARLEPGSRKSGADLITSGSVCTCDFRVQMAQSLSQSTKEQITKTNTKMSSYKLELPFNAGAGDRTDTQARTLARVVIFRICATTATAVSVCAGFLSLNCVSPGAMYEEVKTGEKMTECTDARQACMRVRKCVVEQPD